jgi:molybdopterin biosynthesis enzyme
VGVIDGDALVSVGEADRVLDGEDVIDADSVALSEALSDAVSEADSEALSEALSEDDSEALSEAVIDALLEAVLVAVFDGVSVLDGDAPTDLLQTQTRSCEHSSTVSSALK